MNIAIIGNGIAGISAAEAVRKASTNASIVVLGAESSMPYYRMNLPRLLAGELDIKSLSLHSEEWYEKNNIQMRRGVTATAILPNAKLVERDDGSRLSYDRLILATGARVRTPNIQGVELDGVFMLRTIADTEAILKRLESRPACAVIGSGTLGLEIAAALNLRGLQVTLINSRAHLLHRHLTPAAGALLEQVFDQAGVRVVKNTRSNAILGESKATGVALEDGRSVEADLIVAATGAEPEIGLAKAAGIKVNRGIIVDEHLRTSDEFIFAAGDVAEFNGFVYGTWAPAKAQGEIAGLNAAGSPKCLEPSDPICSTNVLGMHVFSMGRVAEKPESDLVIEQAEGSVFRRFLFEEGRLAGCILVGDSKRAGLARKAIQNKKDFSGSLPREASADDICKLLTC